MGFLPKYDTATDYDTVLEPDLNLLKIGVMRNVLAN